MNRRAFFGRPCGTARSVSLLCALLLPFSAPALILTGLGNKPVHDAGWPEGALTVANLESRVGWWEGPPFGGGRWQFLYRGDTKAFNQALTNFAAIRSPELALVLHDGPETNDFLREGDKPQSDARVDWTFTVWHPASWHRLFNDPKSVFSADQPGFRQPVDPPRLDVYLGGGGGIDWAKVAVPANVRVLDERASAAGVPIEGGALLRVEVFDMASGKPIRDARVTVLAQARPRANDATVAEAATDASGRAQLEKIPAGSYRVVVARDGSASRLVGYQRLGEGSFKSFTVELAPAEALRGQVVEVSGKPVAGLKVRASNVMGLNGRGYPAAGTLETVTDAEGRFELTGLPAGFSQLSLRAPGYYHGDIFTIYDVPTTNLTLRVMRGSGLRVIVTDKAGNRLDRLNGNELLVSVEPKGGAGVGSWGGSAKVKADGTVEFADMPAGEYRVSSRPNPATADKQYAPDHLVEVKPGEWVEVTITYE